MLAPWKKSYDQSRQHIKKQRHYFAHKDMSSQSYGFSSSHVWMWELDYKESWGPKNWCFWTMALEKTLESHLDCKKIQPISPERNQSWIFTGRTNAEAETPILWPPDGKNRLIGKDADAGKDWRREEKGSTEDEMVGWHHRLNEHEFEQAPGVGDGQGSLACCGPWGRKETRLSSWTDWWLLIVAWGPGEICSLDQTEVTIQTWSIGYTLASVYFCYYLPRLLDGISFQLTEKIKLFHSLTSRSLDSNSML